MDIKSIKNEGKNAFKANYWRCVLVAFIMGLLVTGGAAASGRGIGGTGEDANVQGLTDAVNSLTAAQQAAFAGIALGTIGVIVIISILLRVFLFNPLEFGGYRFFKKNLSNPGTGVGTMAEGFGNYGHTFMTLFLRDLFLCLWSILFVIPGIVKSYSYMLVPYLIKDNPELSATEAITRSREMMNGHKWEAFVLDLSFIGWFLLGAVTADLVNIFWTQPYHKSARARFYMERAGNR